MHCWANENDIKLADCKTSGSIFDADWTDLCLYYAIKHDMAFSVPKMPLNPNQPVLCNSYDDIGWYWLLLPQERCKVLWWVCLFDCPLTYRVPMLPGKSWNFYWKISRTWKQQQQKPFYGSVEFVRENPGEPVPEETFTHYSHRSHQSSLSAFSI